MQIKRMIENKLIKKIIKLDFSSIEKKAIDFILLNRFKIYLLVVVAFILRFISSLPYLNLIITNFITILILVIFSMYIFKPYIKRFLFISVILFPLMFLFTFLQRDEVAEMLGNLEYAILLVGVIVIFREMLKDEKNN